jgi:Na+-transporting NADH:ubiquinone oxidoreductase subunit NqrA
LYFGNAVVCGDGVDEEIARDKNLLISGDIITGVNIKEEDGFVSNMSNA